MAAIRSPSTRSTRESTRPAGLAAGCRVLASLGGPFAGLLRMLGDMPCPNMSGEARSRPGRAARYDRGRNRSGPPFMRSSRWRGGDGVVPGQVAFELLARARTRPLGAPRRASACGQQHHPEATSDLSGDQQLRESGSGNRERESGRRDRGAGTRNWGPMSEDS